MKTRLIVADSEKDSNMLYATRLFVPDPFIFLEVRGSKYVVLSDLELDRARRQSKGLHVLSYMRYRHQLKRDGLKEPRFVDVLNRVLRDLGVRKVEVPANFPVGLARKLKKIRLVVNSGPFYPEREIKKPQEIKNIREALRLTEMGMAAAMSVLRRSRIGRQGYLHWRGHRLTSEHVQGVINATIAGLGGTVSHTIVACGNQGCDPHECGHGLLRAHKPIIIDIFPRDTKTGYYGDITRTVVRGRASEMVKKMYAAVAVAQGLGFKKLRAGVNGQCVHAEIQQFFKHLGFKTRRKRGRMQGFFHGTGHGLGLDIHERPRVSSLSEILRVGQVLTVEPGLYYWGYGGVRLEDVVVVQTRKVKNLTKFPKFLEI